MSKFSAYFVLITLLLTVVNSGCCGLRPCSSGCGPLYGIGSRLACSGGCGEIYVGEYTNHPPVCDPCGSCDGCSCGADYVGHGCQPFRPFLQRYAALWGVPYQASNCGNCGVATCETCHGGCSSCARGVGPEFHGEASHGSSCNCGSSHAGVSSMPSGEVYGGSLTPVPAAVARESQPMSSRTTSARSRGVVQARSEEVFVESPRPAQPVTRSKSTVRRVVPMTQGVETPKLVATREIPE